MIDFAVLLLIVVGFALGIVLSLLGGRTRPDGQPEGRSPALGHMAQSAGYAVKEAQR